MEIVPLNRVSTTTGSTYVILRNRLLLNVIDPLFFLLHPMKAQSLDLTPGSSAIVNL